jgi:vacuolar iron transporter family protein
MKTSIKKGFSFGLTSGIITTLGLMVGLYATTHSQTVVIGGILTIAVADSLSDAMGMHISEESDRKNTPKQVWEATIATFLAKLVFALTFIIPVLLLTLDNAILVSILWGISAIAIISYFLAREHKEKALHVILEHLVITITVIVTTHLIGGAIGDIFGS